MRFIATGCGLVVGFLMLANSGQAQYGPRGGIYDKPYLRGEEPVKVGGYVDMEFVYTANPNPAADASEFDQHRLIPFLFAEITSNMHFSTEIEYEHGGNLEEGGEIKVEYMIIDYRFTDAFQFRSGILLSPLGKFNLIHDSPVNDLTDRPLVDQQIIPTTLSEAGAGLFGTVYPSPSSVLNYEVYLVNGFDDGVITADSSVRVRSGRGRMGEDNNPNKALVARLGWSPMLGVDLGLSTHMGKYDDIADDMLTIFAADAEYRRGSFEIMGELAQAETERDHLGLEKQTQRGYYAQANYHFLQDRLIPGSTFTGVLRYDWVDYSVKGSPDDRVSRLTLGLNFRPVEKAVFKTDFQTNWTKSPGAETERENYRFFASVATYF